MSWTLSRLFLRPLVVAPLILLGLAAKETALPPSVTAAQARRDRAITKAEREYDRAVIDAEHLYVAYLEAAKKEALLKEDLNSANAIVTLKKEAEDDIARLTAGGRASHDSGNLLRSIRSVGASVRTVGDAVEVTGDGLLETKAEFPVPLRIDFVAKVSPTDLRLHFGRGGIILNWADNRDELRYTDPATGSFPGGIGGRGSIPSDQWVHITWEISDSQAALFVDGQRRATFTGPYKGFSGRIGIGSWGHSVATVRSVTATAK